MTALALLAALSGAAVEAPACGPMTGAETVKAEYLADRWVYTPSLAEGGSLRFYLDSGGGANMLFRPTVDRLGLAGSIDSGGAGGPMMVPVPALGSGPDQPSIPSMDNGPPRLMIPPAAAAAQLDFGAPMDGFLGRVFLAGRAWTFDYPGRRLLWYPGGIGGDLPADCWVSLGFQVDSAGRRTTNFARIAVTIDGETLDLLFDTGATTFLVDSALAAIGDGGPAHRGASFMARSVVERWRGRHPDWPTIERAERGSGARAIRVPEVKVGGVSVGPVWFTERPDRNFHEYMTQWMDRRVEGAIGGSAFRYLRVTIDYLRARARFER